jgi:hypothetical protein
MGTEWPQFGVHGYGPASEVLRKMVDRGRIELPTPGFSDLGLKSWKYAKLLDAEDHVGQAFVRWNALEWARMRWRWTQNGHKSTPVATG